VTFYTQMSTHQSIKHLGRQIYIGNHQKKAPLRQGELWGVHRKWRNYR